VPEHHANVDVVVTVVRGTGAFTGDVVVMPPRARHSIEAESDLELVVVHARLQPGADTAGCGA
jgi:quercetin dioxygenase-like cupin family protein